MKKNKPIIKYPTSITKWFHTAKELENPSEVLDDDPIYNHVQGMLGIIKKSGLGDKVRYSLSDEGDNVEVQILIPDGRIFTGIAIMKEGDINNPAKALCIAIGRAIAVWRASTGKTSEMDFWERHETIKSYEVLERPFNIKDVWCPIKVKGFVIKCIHKQVTLECECCAYKEKRVNFSIKRNNPE